MASRRKGRILAFQALYCWEASHSPVEELTEFLWLEDEKREKLEPAIAGFSRALITGTLENIKPIDDTIRSHLQNWAFSRVSRVDLAILRMSVYTLMYQKDMSASIVIDEAIGISKEFGSDDSYRFVNGVLDAIRISLGIPAEHAKRQAAVKSQAKEKSAKQAKQPGKAKP